MTSAEPTFDGAGTFVASSYVDATARDFARFGLLALRDGVWDGAATAPRGLDRPRPPAPLARRALHPRRPLVDQARRSRGLFNADGFEGQRIYVVPELDLVLVRLGKTHTDHSPTMDEHLFGITEQFDPGTG